MYFVDFMSYMIKMRWTKARFNHNWFKLLLFLWEIWTYLSYSEKFNTICLIQPSKLEEWSVSWCASPLSADRCFENLVQDLAWSGLGV